MRGEKESKAKRRNKRPAFAKKSLGQNFLRDDRFIGRIVAALDLDESDTVVEVGPGRGALTEKLLESGAKVIAIEIDRNLAPTLRTQFHFSPNFKCIEADILQTEIGTILAGTTPNKTKLVGNLPYNISTAILQKLAAERSLFSKVVLMLQREVVQRITAAAGNSERGFLTVLVEAAFDNQYLFDVPPDAFSPRPKVWSSVIRLTPREESFADEPEFRKFLGKAFIQKRKTLLNNLKPHFENAMMLIEACGIDPKRRAETLTLEEWARVFAELR